MALGRGIQTPTPLTRLHQLHENKMRAPRRRIEPSVVQGLVSCRLCGYALSRASTRSSARPIHYYRCLGSDGRRHLGGPVCKNPTVQQDLLDQIVWTGVMRLLQDPALIEQELDRRLAAESRLVTCNNRERVPQSGRELGAWFTGASWVEALGEFGRASFISACGVPASLRRAG
jgi:hypothetical protein